tara:strand:- start:5997 stop:7010 length:1014 start_codon:yes stop_codon:yes gene_type:complete
MQKINWGIIGLGSVAKEFANGFNDLKNAKLLAIASKDFNKIETFKNNHQIQDNYCFERYEDLINSKEIDIIYIALPTFLHKKWIIECLAKEKNVLVEKPITINSKEILEIDKIYKNQSFIAEGFMYLFHPQIKKTIQLIQDGEIGELISMTSFFGTNLLTKKNWFGLTKNKKIDANKRIYNKEMGGGAILDLGCYPISFSTKIASLIDKIEFEKIDVVEKKVIIGSTNVDIDSYITLKFNNNFISRVGASFSRDIGRKTEIKGSKGKLIIEDTWSGNPSRIILKKENNEKIFDITSKKNIYSYEIEALSYALLNVDNTGLGINEKITNMKIIDKWKT